MAYKIGVYGSYIAESEQAVQAARELGKALVQQDIIGVTGDGSGMPYTVAHMSKQMGAEVWRFTCILREEQKQAYPFDDIAINDRLLYVPRQYNQLFFLDQPLPPARDWSARLKYRNVVPTIHVDAGIIISGGWGTMNEFTNLLYDGKPIGVLLRTGGLADELPAWFPRLRKKSESIVHLGLLHGSSWLPCSKNLPPLFEQVAGRLRQRMSVKVLHPHTPLRKK